jgi:hypothetical protein
MRWSICHVTPPVDGRKKKNLCIVQSSKFPVPVGLTVTQVYSKSTEMYIDYRFSELFLVSQPKSIVTVEEILFKPSHK